MILNVYIEKIYVLINLEIMSFFYRLSAEDLRFDEDWGLRVQSVDPLPGQPGLAEGDFIVAIDGAQNYWEDNPLAKKTTENHRKPILNLSSTYPSLVRKRSGRLQESSFFR